MKIESILAKEVCKAVENLYGLSVEEGKISLQKTRKEFEGDLTLVVFPFVRSSRKSPEDTAKEMGEYLLDNVTEVAAYNVVKGFLNMVITDGYWLDQFNRALTDENFGAVQATENDPAVVVEYSSPNTNKPLHLGHVRNNLLGYAVAEIIKASGKRVHKVQIINDRGIHICKSMLAWQKYGNGETPSSSGIKGDHLVGKYYIEFDKHYKEEIKSLIEGGLSEDEAKSQAPSLLEAQEMLRKWEAKDPEVYTLWETMNEWVYSGFADTYKRMGVDFDKNYYESFTYIIGKSYVEKGLEAGIFYKKDDGSVWVDLTDEGLDHKLLLRSDGTSVYMTQDIGTAILRFEDLGFEKMVYTVGNEQDYHFKVLFKILKKLGYDWAEECEHLSYGMVDLPSGKMKSREGTVVDADDLMQQMQVEAKNEFDKRENPFELTDEEAVHLHEMVGMGALKYFILKVDPKKRMLFDPNESIELQGHTGPFIQYTHARSRSIIRKAAMDVTSVDTAYTMNAYEKDTILFLLDYPATIQTAAAELSPAVIANYTYHLVKEYNRMFQNASILKAENNEAKAIRVAITKLTGTVIASSMNLLGIGVPERM